MLGYQKISDAADYLSSPGTPGSDPAGFLADADGFGEGVASLGLFDGDSVPDLVVGSRGRDNGMGIAPTACTHDVQCDRAKGFSCQLVSAGAAGSGLFPSGTYCLRAVSCLQLGVCEAGIQPPVFGEALGFAPMETSRLSRAAPSRGTSAARISPSASRRSTSSSPRRPA